MTLFEMIGRFGCWWVVNIDMFFLALLLLGSLLLLRRRAWGKWLIVTSFIGFIFIGIVPFGLWSLENLENRFPKMTEIPPDTEGMIFLAGTFYVETALARGEPAHNVAVGRFINFSKLAKKHPHLQIVYTGKVWESALARRIFKALEIDSKRILFEEESTNTLGNAANTAALLKPKPDEKWVLVTSASHMPRSVGLFRKAGFNVIPYPVDYHTPGNYEMWFFPGLKRNLNAWNIASREWLGMIASYLMGKSDELFPHP